MVPGMRHLVFLLLPALVGLAGASGWLAAAEERDESATGAVTPHPVKAAETAQTCLSSGDLREAVAEKRVVEPVAAIRAARAAVPRADIVRANLCRRDEALVYMLTALRKDGQFVHVVVDARSGKVAGQW